MDALLRINKHFGITVICNLHSLDLARSYCDRLIGMASGRIVFDGAPAALTDQHRARTLRSRGERGDGHCARRSVPAAAQVPALGSGCRCLSTSATEISAMRLSSLTKQETS